MLRRRRRDGLDTERVQDVGEQLDALLAEVAAGSELLYDGLPASSLDRQPLALAIGAHLARPAIPTAVKLLGGLCTTVGLCMGRAGRTLRQLTEALQKQAAMTQTAVERSQCFWCAMLDELPDRCRQPLSLSCCWWRRAHCRHQAMIKAR